MSVHFGTDGIRGKFGSEITISVAMSVGNVLGLEKPNSKIIIINLVLKMSIKSE